MKTDAINENNETTLSGEYYFAKGIPAFEKLKKFYFQRHNEYFSLMVSIEDSEKSFIIVNPFDFVENYEFELSEEHLNELGITCQKEITVYSIVTWHSDPSKITLNLLAPLVINRENRKGKQIVLQNTAYTTRHRLWTNDELATNEGGGQ